MSRLFLRWASVPGGWHSWVRVVAGIRVIMMYQDSVDGREGTGKPTGYIYSSTGCPGCP